MAGRGHARALRVTVFTLVCLLLSAAGHGVANGAPPALAGIVAGAGVVLFVGQALAGRERSFAQILAAVLGSQVALHVIFSSAAAADAPQPVYSALDHHHAAPADASVGLLGHGPWAAAAMLAGHAVAGLLAAWWLRRGEALAWRVCRRIGDAIAPLLRARRLPRISPVATRPLAVPLSASRPLASSVLLRHSVILRGPPQTCVL